MLTFYMYTFYRNGNENQYNTLRLPDIPFENFTLLEISLTDNQINAIGIHYANIGPFTAINLQYSNLLL